MTRTTQPEDILIPKFHYDAPLETKLQTVYILRAYIHCLQDDLVRIQAVEETDRDNDNVSYLPDFWHPPKLSPIKFDDFFEWIITEESYPEVYLYRAHDLLSAIPRDWEAFNVSIASVLAGFSMYDVRWYVLSLSPPPLMRSLNSV